MNDNFATKINEYIAEMLSESKDVTDYDLNKNAIEDSFACNGLNHCTSEIVKEDIYRQLALIDMFYSTNVYRMRRFGLEEMADGIYDLCKGTNGKHTLGGLSSKLNATRPLHPDVKRLFPFLFGYIDGVKNAKAPSLLSKYFYFVSLVCPIDEWGFPIYDSIVCGLLRRLQRKLGILPLAPCQNITQSNANFDIDVYIDGLKRLIDVLEANNPTLWKTSGKLKYDLLDYFLWHIGKAGMGSYESLMTKAEYLNYLATRNVPIRIQNWEGIYNSI